MQIFSIKHAESCLDFVQALSFGSLTDKQKEFLVFIRDNFSECDN